MGDREQDKERLDIWFSSGGKAKKRVTFEKRTRAEIRDILDKAKAVVELFKLYDNFQFAISDDIDIGEER